MISSMRTSTLGDSFVTQLALRHWPFACADVSVFSPMASSRIINNAK